MAKFILTKWSEFLGQNFFNPLPSSVAARRVIMMQVSIIQSFDYNRTIHWINGVEAAKQNFQIKIN